MEQKVLSKGMYTLKILSGFLLPIAGFMIGGVLQRWEDERLSKFRDKSALYGRELKPGEPPSWP